MSPSTPGTVNYPSSLDDSVSLIDAGNGATTTLGADILVGATTIQLTSATGFPTSGTISIIDPVAGNEIAYYNGVSTNTLQSVLKGQEGTTDLAHTAVNVTSVNEWITARHHTVLRDALVAVEGQLGVGATARTLFNRRSGTLLYPITVPAGGDFGVFEKLEIGPLSQVTLPATSSLTIYSSDPPRSAVSTTGGNQDDGIRFDTVVSSATRVLLNKDATLAGTTAANSSDEFTLAVQTLMEPTHSLQTYEKAGLIVESHTIDPSGGGLTIGTLSGTLSTGSPITSLPVNALAADYGGGQLTLTSGGNTQIWQVTQDARAGSTSLNVVSQTPNFAYTSGTALVDNTFRDCVGVDMRGSIQGAIQTGRAWGGISEADCFAGTDGLLVAHEFQVTNAGSDQPAVGTNTSKYGQHIVSKASTASPTAAIFIEQAAGSLPFHKGYVAAPAALGSGTTDTFLELIGLFEVFPQTGQTVIGGPTALFTTTLLEVQAPNSVIDPLVLIGSTGNPGTYSMRIENSNGTASYFVTNIGGAFLSDTALGDTGVAVITSGRSYRIGGTSTVLAVTNANTLGFHGASSGGEMNLRSDMSGTMVVPASSDFGICERLVVGATATVEIPATSSLTIYNVT